MRPLPWLLAAVALHAAGCSPKYRSTEDLLSIPLAPEPMAEETPRAEGAVSLARALELTLESNPRVQAAEAQVLAADAARVQAGAWANPFLDFEAEGLDLGEEETTTELTLSLGLPIDLAGVRSARASQADAALLMERARYLSVRRQVEAEAREAHVSAIAAAERLRTAQAAHETARAMFESVALEVEAGKASQLDFARWQAATGRAREAERAAETELALERSRLASLWGGSGSDPFDVAGVLRMEPVALDSAGWTRELLETHPDLLELAWEARMEERQASRLKRERWPDIAPQIGVRHTEDAGQSLVAGLSMSLPILDRKGAAVRESELLRASALDRLRARSRELRGEFEQLLVRIRSASQRLDAYRSEILPPAEEASRLVRRGYEEGKFRYLEVLDGQAVLNESRREMAGILIDLNEALVGLESLMGRELTESQPQEER